jgi:adenosylmethionine-8-amino-7-oxononanoate aminotransferase
LPHRYPESAVFYRKLARSFPLIARGEGCWLVDEDGRRYLDASGGAFVANIGHGVAEIADVMARQARELAYVSGAMFTHQPVEELAAELARLCPGDLDKVYPLSSGSDAVEAALKLARQYWVERGHGDKRTIVALAPAYHGNTLLALSASAREHYRTYYSHWLVDVVHIRAPYSYRCECGGTAPYCPSCSGDVLEEAIVRAGPDTIAAFIVEPVGGSSTGASVPQPDYHRRAREICDRYDVLLIADEVLTGAGRTGTWCAIEPYGVVPDILILGKGISGGYAPLSAVVAPERIVGVLAEGSGALVHAQTFSHHPLSCAVGAAVVRHIAQHRLVERCATMGTIFHRKLAALRELPHVGDVRGRGLLAGVELVQDVGTRTPFPRAIRVAEKFGTAALEAGLVVWPNTGQLESGDGDLVMLAPPFIITEAEIDDLVRRFAAALHATLSQLPVARA